MEPFFIIPSLLLSEILELLGHYVAIALNIVEKLFKNSLGWFPGILDLTDKLVIMLLNETLQARHIGVAAENSDL